MEAIVVTDPSSTRRTMPVETGEMLRSARGRARLGLRQAARMIGTSHGALWLVERGDRRPSVTMAELIADVYRLAAVETLELLDHATDAHGRDWKPVNA